MQREQEEEIRGCERAPPEVYNGRVYGGVSLYLRHFTEYFLLLPIECNRIYREEAAPRGEDSLTAIGFHYFATETARNLNIGC